MNRLVVTGYPLNHSLSPVMQNAALSAMNLNQEFRYDLLPLPENQLCTLVDSIHNGTILGANVTIPYKTKIMGYIDGVSDLGLSVGSVNTLFRRKSKVVGYNTDVTGFMEVLCEHGICFRGSTATILGAGGAAKAVTTALVEVGIDKLHILNRDLVKGEQLASTVSEQKSLEIHVGALRTSKDSLAETDILVNCTPIGMKGHSPSKSPVPKEALHRNLVVMDLVYNPLNTKLLRDSQEVGCKTIDGTSMLAHQGAKSLEIWTGRKAPIAVMKGAVLQALEVWSQ